MLLLVLIHLLIALACFTAGLAFYQVSGQLKANQKHPAPVFIFFSGLVTLSAITQLTILLMPVTVALQAAIGLALLIFAFVNRRRLKPSWRFICQYPGRLPVAALLAIFAGWVIILIINAGPTNMDDTESYHIQSVKWIREYGTVPGLANLHVRYGFNSSWFSSIALFSLPSSAMNLYTALNGLLSISLLIYLISEASRPGVKLAYRSGLVLLLVLGLYAWPLIRGNAANTGYDFITAVMVLVLLIETLKNGQKSPPLLEWAIWPAFLFTIRITNGPLLLLSLAAVLIVRRNKPFLAKGALAFCAFMIGLFLLRMYLLSGYPFYPLMAFGTGADWQADARATQDFIDFTRMFNRVGDQYQDIAITATQSLTEWLPLWLRFMPLHDKLILIGGTAGLLVSAFMLKRPVKTRLIPYLLMGTLFLQWISWFFVSPDPRFIYGPLLCGWIAPFLLWSERPPPMLAAKTSTPDQGLPNQVSRRTFNSIWKQAPAVTILLVCAALGLYTGYSRATGSFPFPYLTPVSLTRPPVQQVTLHKIILNIPGKVNGNWNARCFDSPLPCLYEVLPGLEPRGESISRGFRIKRD